MRLTNTFKFLTVAASVLTSASMSLSAQELTAKSVVLVHGAFADGSAWNKVVPILKKAGLNVIAAQIPLSSLKEDVAVTNRAIANAQGPVVLVGHSWGGMVITETGGQDKVKSLVYVAAFAPNKGDSLKSYTANYPHADGLDHLIKDSAGYYKLSRTGILEHFAFDLSTDEAELLFSSQGPINSLALGEKVTQAAWKNKPNFAVVSTQDRMTHTAIQQDQLKKLNATSVEVETSHVPMLTYPKVVADMIIKAAK